jgi:ribosomal protein L37E
MKEKVICKECGAENYAIFQDVYDINWMLVKGMESAMVECWKCQHCSFPKRRKKYNYEVV